MEIIPDIYILDGQCVALYKSSYEQKETYFKSPLEMARYFERGGAKKIYLTDLDGKRDNTFRQRDIVKKITETLEIPVIIETGFGSLDEIREAFALGVSRVVIRPVANALIREAIREFGAEKIMVLIQAKGSELIDGSPETADDVVDYAESLVPLGVKNVVYKDERSEGTLIHPNYDEVDRLFLITGKDLSIYVAGGISEAKHIRLLKKIGAAGAIIGKAFFEKIITIEEAESAARE